MAWARDAARNAAIRQRWPQVRINTVVGKEFGLSGSQVARIMKEPRTVATCKTRAPRPPRERVTTRGGHAMADRVAQQLFGKRGVAYSHRRTCYVGRFLKDPYVGSPPWPIEIWGEGETWNEAVTKARALYESEQR